MLQEYAQGNTEAAHGWRQAMEQAIGARSEAQVRAMERQRGLDDGYFLDMADRHRLALVGK